MKLKVLEVVLVACMFLEPEYDKFLKPQQNATLAFVMFTKSYSSAHLAASLQTHCFCNCKKISCRIFSGTSGGIPRTDDQCGGACRKKRNDGV